MPHIAIISSSVRPERKSHRVALYFQNYLKEKKLASTEILDLKEYNFPVFEDILQRQIKPTTKVLEFAEKIKSANGIIIITPEYNGAYPASLKNVIDVLYEEWHRKPVAIATVSTGILGGSQAIIALQFILWKMRAWTVPVMFPVPKVEEVMDTTGKATDPIVTDKLANVFIKELLWCIEANQQMSKS